MEVTKLKIGFIGAGKVGTSLGKYFSTHQVTVTGFYSRTEASAKEATKFTNTNFYPDRKQLIADSDVIFLTVTDSAIAPVWESIKHESIQGKIFCHCSGSLSSGIFSDIQHLGAYGYSIHPLYAISSKTESYKDLAHALFTLEGDSAYLQKMRTFMEGFGNDVQIISTESKALYHAAAVFASNHMVALAYIATNLFQQCGFSSEHALQAIAPLMEGNLAHILSDGPVASLTGPVERNDVATIQRHLECLPAQYQAVYRELTKILVDIGSQRHPNADYTDIQQL